MDPFLTHSPRQPHRASPHRRAREQGLTALADQIERDEARRTIQALQAHGYRI
jgi:hypothetical protein